jgi:hypothetical protein
VFAFHLIFSFKGLNQVLLRVVTTSFSADISIWAWTEERHGQGQSDLGEGVRLGFVVHGIVPVAAFDGQVMKGRERFLGRCVIY